MSIFKNEIIRMNEGKGYLRRFNEMFVNLSS